MDNKVEFTRSALDDIGRVVSYIENDSRVYAKRFQLQVVNIARTLTQFPERGRKVPEYNRDDLREILWGYYRLIYQLKENKIFIIAFLHGAQELNAEGLGERFRF